LTSAHSNQRQSAAVIFTDSLTTWFCVHEHKYTTGFNRGLFVKMQSQQSKRQTLQKEGQELRFQDSRIFVSHGATTAVVLMLVILSSMEKVVGKNGQRWTSYCSFKDIPASLCWCSTKSHSFADRYGHKCGPAGQLRYGKRGDDSQVIAHKERTQSTLVLPFPFQSSSSFPLFL
jgi:hypothetical protein